MNSNQPRKLKLDRSAIIRFTATLILCLAALYVIIAVLDAKSWGPGLHTFDYFLMSFYALLALIQLIPYSKTRVITYLGFGLALFSFIPLLVIGQSPYSEWRFLFYLLLLVLFFWGGPIRKRHNPHFRQVLELAARPVSSLGEDFTHRPFPAGQCAYRREEIVSFADFLMKHWIVTAYMETERVVLTIAGFSWKYYFTGVLDFQQLTHVAFDFQGNVSVNITRKDYQKFRDQLAFEALCQALGNLLKTFLQMYQSGNKTKILTVIDEEMSRSHWFFSAFSLGSPVNSTMNEG